MTDVSFSDNPLHTLARWAQEAEDAGEPSSRTMTFATSGADGTPHARTVLTTVIDDESVRFHSSRPTTKTRDLAENPRSSGVFYWPGLARQVVMDGTAHQMPADVSREAYPARPPQLQLLAWVYEELNDDDAVTTADPDDVLRVFDAHAQRDPLPMPPSWTTVRLIPERMMFWVSHGPDRPPWRVCFDLAADGTWNRRHVLP
ncbi:pyridoxine/pyridoxamine 5'-phosphate oxidase [Phytoactinopolyspora endophytica]|uniref:pyridoxine/pyridoxamine 5'-phosphate oxidase n=1 Tax=Phytoactinopolyspora endophytica TaxID=1642495 RepID=UPI00101DFF37|nr:pyridoxamine 5'-phosphate oxidase family protein [Phytoactinopolyspora endophytica]